MRWLGHGIKMKEDKFAHESKIEGNCIERTNSKMDEQSEEGH